MSSTYTIRNDVTVELIQAVGNDVTVAQAARISSPRSPARIRPSDIAVQ